MPLLFITGGVRSGKSHFAEQTAIRYYQEAQQNKRLLYIASGVALDAEMASRIARHQADRQTQAVQWLTMEAPVDLADALAQLQTGDIVLWDCVTTWLANALYDGFEAGTPCISQSGCLEQKLAELKQAIQMALTQQVTLLVVSNELFEEPPYANREVELYRQTLGELHQWLASIADEAYEMDYGCLKKWK
ncbi:bifunctional adenosylcobinamide kinase/adenosylcobinamide-phosphate guanylyltransferase [Lysinibacillus piscis]|uniref:Adenosylcobinamide kinase n=1 Tax=Lysinibacillus piscis TaxID=2518931 RepID=A0ABQ5NL92_9BACI|nr:bifunctional adenosylcobinamide kinase/adenosylcobinamide-phosphate guanylyltransferase [Lysinibacillus sp. KH24]GLC88867.1 adenosylcobinamide kinase/adenosylcobinamide phosphate guanyltransferase [Lysinibacillus sp. KH24]